MTVQQLADSINRDSAQLRWFWVYGILKETASLWTPERESLLDDNARVILHSIQEQ